MIAACRLRGGRLLATVAVVVVDANENCCLSASAYNLLDAEYTGLSRRCGNWDDGGSIPSGIDCRIIGSKLSSIHARASGKLGLVVTIRHLRRPTSSMRRNQGLRRR